MVDAGRRLFVVPAATVRPPASAYRSKHTAQPPNLGVTLEDLRNTHRRATRVLVSAEQMVGMG